MKLIKTLTTVGALGLALAGCGGNGNGVTLPPQPPSAPGQQPVGPFTQIERLSRPAIKEVFETFVQHQATNMVEPYADPTIQNAIKSTEDALRPPTANTDYGATLQTILYPDQYRVDLSQTAGGFLGAETGAAPFGGRNINDDVIGTELGLLFGNTLSTLPLGVPDDHQENNCLSAQNVSIAATQKSTTSFPYLANPL